MPRLVEVEGVVLRCLVNVVLALHGVAGHVAAVCPGLRLLSAGYLAQLCHSLRLGDITSHGPTGRNGGLYKQWAGQRRNGNREKTPKTNGET